MLRLTEDTGGLQVYNGIEERGPYKSLDGSRPLSEMCSWGYEDDKCWFKKECTLDVKLLHRNLILGEPLKIDFPESLPPPMRDLFNSWDLNGLKYVLDVAEQELEKIKALVHFEVVKTDKDEKDLYIGIAMIKAFIQLNYTGPDIPNDEVKEQLRLFEAPAADSENSEILRTCLEIDGIELEENVKSPVLLLMAKYFLSSMENDRATWLFHLIWRFRIDFLHQRMLSRHAWSLSRNLKYYADMFIQWLDAPHKMDGVLEDVKATFLCEISQMLIFYYDGILSERFLKQAKVSLGLSADFTGKLGFRTQFQQTPAPQTVIEIYFNPRISHCDRSDPTFPALSGVVPRSEALNDDTRLENIRLVEETPDQPHLGIHQLILTGMMFRMGGVDETELERQKIEALIRVVIDNPVNWSCRFSAIMERCRLEKLDRRAIDRSLRQLEELWKTVSKNDETAHSLYRQHLFFASGHPTKSEIKATLGEILLSVEHWKEALSIYTELSSFENIVKCYEMMDLRHKAEENVRERIKEFGETPKLLVLLGDVTSDKSCYQRAWVLSSSKSVDSQIRLGDYHFKRKEYAESVTYYMRVVELAPLEYPCWIRLAWASYQTDNYETAYQAYLHAANMEYDVWNNLGNCALKLDRKEYALRAYKEAVKCSYDEWKVWNNILTVSADLKILPDALMAYHRILDLNKLFVDEEVLHRLANIVVVETKPTSSSLGNLGKLFGRVTSKGVRTFLVWLLYGRLLVSYIDCDDDDCDEDTKLMNFQRGLQKYEKALTLGRQNPSWKSELSLIRKVVNCIREFRRQRERGGIMLGTESISGLKNLDVMLKHTASSVFKDLENLSVDLPANEEFKEIFSSMKEEMDDKYYA